MIMRRVDDGLMASKSQMTWRILGGGVVGLKLEEVIGGLWLVHHCGAKWRSAQMLR
jgi:hypothetical protein